MFAQQELSARRAQILCLVNRTMSFRHETLAGYIVFGTFLLSRMAAIHVESCTERLDSTKVLSFENFGLHNLLQNAPSKAYEDKVL
jgi:hypothetical protein